MTTNLGNKPDCDSHCQNLSAYDKITAHSKKNYIQDMVYRLAGLCLYRLDHLSLKKRLFGCPPPPAPNFWKLEKSFYCTKVYRP